MSRPPRSKAGGRAQSRNSVRAAVPREDQQNQDFTAQRDANQRPRLTAIGSNETIINTPLLAIAIPQIVGEDHFTDNKVITNCVKVLGLSENAATLDQFLTAFVRIVTPVVGREATIAFFEKKHNDSAIVPERFGQFSQEQFFLILADCMVRAGYPINLLDNAFEKVGVQLSVEGRGITPMHDARLAEYPSVTFIDRVVTHIKLREFAALTSDCLVEFCGGANEAILSSPDFVRQFARVLKTPGVFNGVEVTDTEIATALAVISPFNYREVMRFLVDTTWNIDTTGNVPSFDLLVEVNYDLARGEIQDRTVDFDAMAERLELDVAELVPVYAALNAVRCRLASPRKGRGEQQDTISDAYRRAIEFPQNSSTGNLIDECQRVFAERGIWTPENFKDCVYECNNVVRELVDEWFPAAVR